MEGVQEVNSNELLTAARIEAAREMLMAEQLFYSQAPDLVEQYDTALAALDLAEQMRWRSMRDDPPERGRRIIWRLEDEDGAVDLVTVTHANLDQGDWMPLPEWEG